MLTTLAFGAIALVVFAALLIVGLFLNDSRHRVASLDGSYGIVYESAVCRLLFRFFRVWAFTLGRTIYVKGDWLAPSALRHELRHVQQWELLGWTTFIYLFVAGIVKHGFHDSPLEVEARRAAARLSTPV